MKMNREESAFHEAKSVLQMAGTLKEKRMLIVMSGKLIDNV